MSKLDLNALSDAELEALSTGNIAALSDQTLKMLAGEKPEAPSTGAVMAEAARKGVASFAAKAPGFRAQYGNQFEQAKQALVAS